NTLFLQAQHTLPLGREASLDIEVHTTGTGKIYWNEANTLRQPFYMQLGASATLGWRDFQAQLWGENLTGTRFDTFYFMSMRNEFLQRGRPWRIGITLRYNFTLI
ncbi:MAG: TonB-dependent receptor, partial [Lepagella sp.]